MKIKVSLVLLVVVAILLAWRVFAEMTLNQVLKNQVVELNQKLNEKSAQGNIDLQAKCADQAESTYLKLGYKNGGLDGYQSHFNNKLNKCFLTIHSIDNSGIFSESIADAYEQRVYGLYMRKSGVDKFTSNPFPAFCNISPTSSEKTNCKSKEEYDLFVSHYME